ncbi:hypothetical protein B0H14DRAFT_3162897 [Mycena olivaceomarginata]|nr:hypothetical protein B0H14DRAFT_3162897 [Mycena olivaceomarginata]
MSVLMYPMNELERLLARLPGLILDTFRDEARPGHLPISPARNQQLFLDTRWVDLDDLKSWLHTKHLSSYLFEDESSETRDRSLDQSPYDLDISSFFQDTPSTTFLLNPLGRDLLHHHRATVTRNLKTSTHPNFPTQLQVPSSEYDWYAHSHTSHSSPASEFAMLEEIAPPAVHSATSTDWDPRLASMLSAFEVAPLYLLENPSQNSLDDYFALLDSSLPISDPGPSSGSSPSLQLWSNHILMHCR